MKAYVNGEIHPRVMVGANPMYPSYIITGDTHNLMIEAGINFFGPLYIKSLDSRLGSHRKLDYLFLTHSHYDHLGAVSYLKGRIPSLRVGANPRVGQIINRESVLAKMRFLGDLQAGLFRDIVGDEDVTLRPFTLDIPLHDGDVFDLGGVTCVVYETPGHTQDHMSYYFPEIRVLVAGEAYGHIEGKDGEIVEAEFLSSYDDYMRSMEKLRVLDVDILCIGHGWYFYGEDVKSFIDTAWRVAREHREMILRDLDRACGDVERAIAMIAGREYDGREGMFQERNAYMANLTAQVRLIASEGRK